MANALRINIRTAKSVYVPHDDVVERVLMLVWPLDTVLVLNTDDVVLPFLSQRTLRVAILAGVLRSFFGVCEKKRQGGAGVREWEDDYWNGMKWCNQLVMHLIAKKHFLSFTGDFISVSVENQKGVNIPLRTKRALLLYKVYIVS